MASLDQFDGGIAFDVLLPVAPVVGDRASREIDIVAYNPRLPRSGEKLVTPACRSASAK